MTQEDEQIQQRRANLEALTRLGLPAYPHRFERTDTVTDLVTRHDASTSEQLEAARVETTTAGRVLAIRSFGKANFLAISDGRARIQVSIRSPVASSRSFSRSSWLIPVWVTLSTSRIAARPKNTQS